jgi:23S rRNA (cytidine1920-2'-O)/16S rRNA (cytidine1409-2'-O)-methyltransferase
VGKRGVVRDAAVHADVLRGVIAAVDGQGWAVVGLTWSPITGPEGNIEFLVRLARGPRPVAVDVDGIVRAAHDALGGN